MLLAVVFRQPAKIVSALVLSYQLRIPSRFLGYLRQGFKVNVEPREGGSSNTIILDAQHLLSERPASIRILIPVGHMDGVRGGRHIHGIAEYLTFGSDDPMRLPQKNRQGFNRSDHPDPVHQH